MASVFFCFVFFFSPSVEAAAFSLFRVSSHSFQELLTILIHLSLSPYHQTQKRGSITLDPTTNNTPKQLEPSSLRDTGDQGADVPGGPIHPRCCPLRQPAALWLGLQPARFTQPVPGQELVQEQQHELALWLPPRRTISSHQPLVWQPNSPIPTTCQTCTFFTFWYFYLYVSFVNPQHTHTLFLSF